MQLLGQLGLHTTGKNNDFLGAGYKGLLLRHFKAIIPNAFGIPDEQLYIVLRKKTLFAMIFVWKEVSFRHNEVFKAFSIICKIRVIFTKIHLRYGFDSKKLVLNCSIYKEKHKCKSKTPFCLFLCEKRPSPSAYNTNISLRGCKGIVLNYYITIWPKTIKLLLEMRKTLLCQKILRIWIFVDKYMTFSPKDIQLGETFFQR